MSILFRPRLPTAILVVAALLGLDGCDQFDVRVAASHLPPYQKAIDRPKNIIDTALDHCPDKTEEKETACVKQALVDRQTSVAALAAMLPGCRARQTCRYTYTTDDRLGYLPAMTDEFVVHWRVSFDLHKPGKAASEVPITVEAE